MFKLNTYLVMKTGDNALSFYMIISDLEEQCGSPYCGALRYLTCDSKITPPSPSENSRFQRDFDLI